MSLSRAGAAGSAAGEVSATCLFGSTTHDRTAATGMAETLSAGTEPLEAHVIGSVIAEVPHQRVEGAEQADGPGKKSPGVPPQTGEADDGK